MTVKRETVNRPCSRQGIPLLLLLLLSAIAGCNQSNVSSSQAQNATAQSQQFKVVTTFLPIYWFTKAVAGDLAQVEILIPPGTEVHEYQAKPKDVQAIATADVLVKNGMGLEEFLARTIKNAQNSQLKVVDSSEGIEPVEVSSSTVQPRESDTQAEGEHDHDHEGEETGAANAEHEHEGDNPHIWLDPVRAKQQVINIRDGLIAADPQNKAAYQANAAAYIQQLETLNREFQQRLQKYPNCTFVTFHDAYPYLANRYGLQQVAVVELPEDQLSPTDVQNTIAVVKKYQVKALFGEPGTDNKLLQGLSQDLNLTLRPVDPLETGPLDPQHYFTAMRANLQNLEAGCQ